MVELAFESKPDFVEKKKDPEKGWVQKKPAKPKEKHPSERGHGGRGNNK